MFEESYFLRLFAKKEVEELTGFSARHIDKLVQDPESKFPKPIALGGVRSSGRALQLRWFGPELKAYLDGLAEQPRWDCRVAAPEQQPKETAQAQ